VRYDVIGVGDSSGVAVGSRVGVAVIVEIGPGGVGGDAVGVEIGGGAGDGDGGCDAVGVEIGVGTGQGDAVSVGGVASSVVSRVRAVPSGWIV
jgi:hypothetical protein